MIELAAMEIVRKPWGSKDLRPWNGRHDETAAIGEIWFERADKTAPVPALLLKLLFTTERLSIQVHPDDQLAHALGLANGKTEAWYVLDAARGAEIALGLKQRIAPAALRTAIADGSVAALADWRDAREGEAISVPAGTIHAIGAGLVIAEIQQRSDTTFRLFDYGRPRELHPDEAARAADPGPAAPRVSPLWLTDTRTLLVGSPYFVFEHIDLPPGSRWTLDAGCETWLLVIAGDARIGSSRAVLGEAVFIDGERAELAVGPVGLQALVAYAKAKAVPDLLLALDREPARRTTISDPDDVPPLATIQPQPIQEAQH